MSDKMYGESLLFLTAEAVKEMPESEITVSELMDKVANGNGFEFRSRRELILYRQRMYRVIRRLAGLGKIQLIENLTAIKTKYFIIKKVA